ncbi:MAG: class IV adenylate cyclase [Bryobacteraceae bacterium]
MKSATETEVKIRVPNSAVISGSLYAAGIVQSVPRQFESNTLYDTENRSLQNQGMLLRLRQIGDEGVITWKGRDEPGPYKTRRELETSVGSIEALGRILKQLGFQPVFRYDKYRTEFTDPRNGAAVVTLDETPIGDFLELEGPGEWIDDTATRLGFSRQDYVLDSYARLYVADCERRGVEPIHMVFAS